MNKTWLTLVIIGLVTVGTVVAWDVFLTITGSKGTFAYNIVPISNVLFGNLEEHLTNDSNYYIYLQEANPDAVIEPAQIDLDGV